MNTCHLCNSPMIAEVQFLIWLVLIGIALLTPILILSTYVWITAWVCRTALRAVRAAAITLRG